MGNKNAAHKHNELDTLPPDDEIENVAEFFKALTDPTRLKILYALGGDELCVLCIAQNVGKSVSSVSHHLSQLKRVRLVKSRRTGRNINYSLDDDHVNMIIKYAREHLCE